MHNTSYSPLIPKQMLPVMNEPKHEEILVPDRNLDTKAGIVNLKVPKLRKLPFETAIIGAGLEL